MSRTRVVVGMTDSEHSQLMRKIVAAATQNELECKLISSVTGVFSRNAKGYIQLRVKGNTKAQLHQVVTWNHPDADMRGQFRHAIEHGSEEISHLCNNKACVNPNHFFPEDSATNKSRNYCECVIFIDDKMHKCCRHEPKCVITKKVLERALRINTTAADM